MYNGWKNYETWNINLWFGADEGMYCALQDYIRCRNRRNLPKSYADFCDWLGITEEDKTPDGVYFKSDLIDTAELDEYLFE